MNSINKCPVVFFAKQYWDSFESLVHKTNNGGKEGYRFPDYAQNTNRHIADQRDQLYWEPAFRPGENSVFSFYTSDVPGEYEIVIEGFTNDGEPISKVYGFWVE